MSVKFESRKLSSSEIYNYLRELSRSDYDSVMANNQVAQKRFSELDDKALQLFNDSDETIIAEKFAPNRSAYTKKAPANESIFIYFDLSTSIGLLNYVIYIRNAIRECLYSNDIVNIRFSDLRLQHSTSFIDILGEGLKVNAAMSEKVKVKYRPIIKKLLPFNLTITGPHIFSTGGIVLEGVVYAQQFYELREFAAENKSHIPQGAERSIHNIIHSTIGYITDATPKQLIKLHQQFQSMREQNIRIPVRIRDGRIIRTYNKGLVGTPIIIPFEGVRANTLSEKEVSLILEKIKIAAPVWMKQIDLKNFVLEEALYWVETSYEYRIQKLAKELIMICQNQVSQE